jgi:hypothetical protein
MKRRMPLQRKKEEYIKGKDVAEEDEGSGGEGRVYIKNIRGKSYAYMGGAYFSQCLLHNI